VRCSSLILFFALGQKARADRIVERLLSIGSAVFLLRVLDEKRAELRRVYAFSSSGLNRALTYFEFFFRRFGQGCFFRPLSGG